MMDYLEENDIAAAKTADKENDSTPGPVSGAGEKRTPSRGEASAAPGGSFPSACVEADPSSVESPGLSNTPYMTYKEGEALAIETSIDYFKVRFDFPYSLSNPDYSDIWFDILNALYVNPSMEVGLNHGGQHYEKCYQFGESLFIFTGGAQTMVGGLESTVIELKGSSCDELVNRAYAHEVYDNGNRELDPNDQKFARWVWANLFRVIAKYPHKVTRFDVPVDDFTGVIPLEELKRKCLAKEYVSRMRVPSIEREISVDDDEAIEDYAKERKCNKGWSFTLGRRTSPSQLCIYDKKAETEGVGVVMAPQWVRFESRFYGDRANELLSKLAAAYQGKDPLGPQRFIVGCLSSLIEFKERRLSKDNTYKASTWEPWKKLIALGEMPQVARLVKRMLTLKENALWLAKGTDRTLIRVLIAYVEDLSSVVRYLIGDGIPKFDKVDLAIANEQRASIGRKPFEDVAKAQVALFTAAGIDKLPSDPVLSLFDDKRTYEMKMTKKKEE